ncbi:hypothetical protein EH165_08185 [Nakamurella antarctica]|uniref:Uncharacterized protein n=1 Tax=Nakamurella antarctica TaxID=1902245 RepID=A0A3G8ZWT1_9ACTN|nr:hypothetical protein [Nakamurella antarctica]AZI58121.1 hypothetical protein EH165_08185 [Nakamurella antarctica]
MSNPWADFGRDEKVGADLWEEVDLPPWGGQSQPESYPAPQLPRGVRFVAGFASLLSAGTLVLGVILGLLMVLLPVLKPGTGFAVSIGPGWDRVVAHLGVGALGELGLFLARRRRSSGWGATAPTVTVALVVLGSVAGLLWWSWWR